MTTAALVPATLSTERHLPPLIAGAGKRAARRFLEFFTVNIRNRNTRTAYARAAAAFLRWCDGQGIGELGRVQPVHVAAYIEELQGERSAPTALYAVLDPHAVLLEIQSGDEEERTKALGITSGGRIPAVVFTFRGKPSGRSPHTPLEHACRNSI